MLQYDNWTRAEIDLDALEHNLRVIRSRLHSGCRVMAMVKADAYGHGAIPVAHCLEAAGVEYLGVANIFEAVSLRDAGIRVPILVAGFTPVSLTGSLLQHDLTQCVPCLEAAQAYSQAAAEAGSTLRIHIKLDTGMSRYGIPCSDHEAAAAREAAEILALPGLDCEGIFTHFASSDAADGSTTEAQLVCFDAVLAALPPENAKKLIKHCANSAAVLKYECTHFDMVRTGLLLYGISPVAGDAAALRPVMTMKAPITQLKTIAPGTGVSYGLEFIAKRPTKIAVIPLGYGDGFLRAYSGAHLTVRGKQIPVVGRVCMDLTMLDVTDVPEVSVGDDVTVFGAAPATTAEDLAKAAGSIHYEVITGISKRVLRLYRRGDEYTARLSYI